MSVIGLSLLKKECISFISGERVLKLIDLRQYNQVIVNEK